ncbi:YwmB family TATA-box binding protein [Pseudogracilibacillus auburnensis]|uniref:YwmB family TATA-box binding protein n=1 Tax=Pseudogracilibacillus auburnensis TaxID=1494959 RepID=UPI001A96AC94|nr:YwmB family TATA-box binding protein [Pseudogracilibacillus auburnensis]MBO1004783.1 YwmB family TATA-box binding protein [Pseudogracilibacillus auburnensis]
MNNIMKCVLYMIVFCFIVIFIGNNTNATQTSPDIQKLAQAIEEQHGKIIGWSLYAREYVQLPTEKAKRQKRQQLQRDFSEMEWTTTDHQLSAVNNEATYSETITFISDDENLQASYIVYELKGSDWDAQEIIRLSTLAKDKYDVLFTHNPVIFSCIKGEFNEKLADFVNLPLKNVLQSLQAKEVEAVKEDDFYSLSAYSSLFEQDLLLPQHKMNVQIGLRQKGRGAGTTLVVGTPILTIEY